MKIWILKKITIKFEEKLNEHILAIYKNKPTKDQLKEFNIYEHQIEHVLNGGGPQNIWDQYWFDLKQTELK